MTPTLDALAGRMWRDFQARRPGTCFADPELSLSLDEAYALQDAVRALRLAAGDRVIGYKVGCTGPGTTAQFGVAGPIRGCLFASEVRGAGDLLPATDFDQLAIEGEMALRIGAAGEIAAAFPVIELHNFVFRAARKTLVELIANNGLNAGIVVPDSSWRSSRRYVMQDATLSVRINGRLRGSGGLWPLPGGPTASLEWLGQHLADAGVGLRPGEIVLAGTPLGLYPVAAGDHVAVCIDEAVVTECVVS